MEGVSLIVEIEKGRERVRITPLSAVQKRIVELLGLSPELYQRLTQLHSP